METIRDRSIEDADSSDIERDSQGYLRTLGQKAAEIFEIGTASEIADADKQNEYIKNVQEERALLETLNSEQREFQDFIFYRAIEDNPEASRFIKSIPGLDTSKPLVAQLIEKNEDGSHKISDETAGNVFEFYQSVLKEEENKFAEKAVEMQANYESNLEKLTASGKLPRKLLENYEKAKKDNNGAIIRAAKIFDMRSTLDGKIMPASAAFIEHSGMNNKGEIVDPEDIKKTMYKKFYLNPQHENALGSIEIVMSHELTHVIAGSEASFNLLPSEKGSSDIPTYMMDTEGAITMAFREGMTEAIGQMLADTNSESEKRSLLYYLRSGKGAYPAERDFLSKLISIDNRCNEEDISAGTKEPLEKLFLEAYAETDKDENVNVLRERLNYILDNWKDVVKGEDFPESAYALDNLKKSNRGWRNAFRIFLLEMQVAYATRGQ